MKKRWGWIAGWVLAAGSLQGVAFAQVGARPACTQNGATWVCNPAMFQKAVQEARTVSLDVRPMDRNGRMQMERLASDLGKPVVQGRAGDLTMALVQVNTEGVNIGPAARELATLSVYAPGAEGQHGALVWSETYSGQADMRWPAVVHALIKQFRASVEKK